MIKTTGRVQQIGFLMMVAGALFFLCWPQRTVQPAYAQGSPVIHQESEVVSGGSGHTCAITSGGGLKCWGLNSSGQLGTGNYTTTLTAADVVGLSSGVVAVSAGNSHTCAVTSGGSAKCWGQNNYGQLGYGSTTSYNTPVDVIGLDINVTTISAGTHHACALTNSGGVQCWGWNGYGQLGDGTKTNALTAVNVVGLSSGVAAISTGSTHTCAITNSGGVKCWGNNNRGQLGDGSTTQSLTPVDVAGLSSNVVVTSAGEEHTCALTNTGGVKCWGDNYYGQIGNGTARNYYLAPVDVAGSTSGIASISAGKERTCASTTLGRTKCWGLGYLGNGTNTESSTPVDVTGLSNGTVSVALGDSHSCALTSSGIVKCWGNNSNGKLGDGTNSYRSTPVDVLSLTVKVPGGVPPTPTPIAPTPTPTATPGGANVPPEFGKTYEPAQNTVIVSSATIQLRWTATDANNDGLSYDVYFGTESNPSLFKGGYSDVSINLTVPFDSNQVASKYNWKIVAKDGRGGTAESPTWTLFAGGCKTPKGINLCELQKGDIIFLQAHEWVDNFAINIVSTSYWTHVGMYTGEGRIVDARGLENSDKQPLSETDQISVRNISESYWWNSDGSEHDWAVIRPTLSLEQRSSAADYAVTIANSEPPIPYTPYKPINLSDTSKLLNWLDRDTEKHFYCSKLVWKAYYNRASYDLETTVGLGSAITEKIIFVFNNEAAVYGTWDKIITPDEIYQSVITGKSTIVQRHKTSDTNWAQELLLKIWSPANMMLVDNAGRRTGLDPVTGQVLTEIPNSYYSGRDVHPEVITVFGNESTMSGWQLQVTGIDQGLYTLESFKWESDFVSETVQLPTLVGEVDNYIILRGKDNPSDLLSPTFPILLAPEDSIIIEEGAKLTYQWQAVSNAASYTFLQTLNPESTTPTVTQINTPALSYTDQQPLIPGLYQWAVKAVSSTGIESTTNHRSFAVAPHNPANMQAAATSCQTVVLSWDDNSNAEVGYHIYRNNAKIGELAALNSSRGEYQDGNLASNTTYEYKVVAYHPVAVLSGITKSVTTPACDGATFALTTSTVGSGTISASTPGPYPSGTQVQLTATPAAGWRFVRWESTATLGDQATQPVITVTVTTNATYTAHFVLVDSPPSTNTIYLPFINR